MTIIKQAILHFTPSGSPDVAGYALYIEEMPNAVTINSERIDLGNPAPVGNEINVDLSTLPGMLTKDSRYNLGVATIDDAGNESSLLTDGLENVALDFAAPNPPSNAFVSYI